MYLIVLHLVMSRLYRLPYEFDTFRENSICARFEAQSISVKYCKCATISELCEKELVTEHQPQNIALIESW